MNTAEQLTIVALLCFMGAMPKIIRFGMALFFGILAYGLVTGSIK